MHPALKSAVQKLGRVKRFVWPAGKWRWPLRAMIVMVPLMIISVEVTSTSGFCRSCHIMEPYYDSWAHGSHKEIACVQCHIAPGVNNFIAAKLNGAGQVVDDLLSRTSTKPSASVSDMACTRSGCHDVGRLREAPTHEGKYKFNHGKHLDLSYTGIEVHCTTCHSHVKGEEHFEVNTNACITCHLTTPKKGEAKASLVAMSVVSPLESHLPTTKVAATQAATQAATAPAAEPAVVPVATVALAHPEGGVKHAPSDCRGCHTAPERPVEYRGLKVVHAEYVAYGANCESCHSNVTEPARKIRDDTCFTCHEFGVSKHTSVEETHRIHSVGRHKVECFSCHGEPAHGPKAQEVHLAQLDCASCHKGQHAVQQNAYLTRETVAHAPTAGGAVSPMFLAHVACSGCHAEQKPVSVKPGSGALVMAASKAACDNCHKPGFGDVVDLWQKNTKQMYEGVTAMLPAESKPLSPLQRQLRGEATTLLELVRQDGSWGVHNPKYTQKLLETAQSRILELERMTPAEAEP